MIRIFHSILHQSHNNCIKREAKHRMIENVNLCFIRNLNVDLLSWGNRPLFVLSRLVIGLCTSADCKVSHNMHRGPHFSATCFGTQGSVLGEINRFDVKCEAYCIILQWLNQHWHGAQPSCGHLHATEHGVTSWSGDDASKAVFYWFYWWVSLGTKLVWNQLPDCIGKDWETYLTLVCRQILSAMPSLLRW